MARPCCLRRIGCRPKALCFKPAGIPVRALDSVALTLDEVEALRLADLEGHYQEQAAARMRISRPTFARIVEAARRKTAEALIHGKVIRLEGGPVTWKGKRMNLVIPVSEDRGLDSPVHGHFGSAPCLLAVDTDTMQARALPNRDRAHAQGACRPVEALGEARPDAVLVGGIGPGALRGLRSAGIAVYRAPEGRAGDAVRLFLDGRLEKLDADATCAGHSHGSSPCHPPTA